MTNESLLKFFFRARLSVRLKLIALGWAACLTIATSSWLIFKILSYHPHQISKHQSNETESPKSINENGHKPVVADYSFVYELKPLSFPITDRRKIRIAYVQLNVVFSMPSKEAIREMELNRAKLMDILLEVAGQFYIEDFNEPIGFETFKGTLLGRYREAFHQKSPTEIAIRDWLLH